MAGGGRSRRVPLRLATEADFAALAALDRAATGLDRADVLRAYFAVSTVILGGRRVR